MDIDPSPHYEDGWSLGYHDGYVEACNHVLELLRGEQDFQESIFDPDSARVIGNLMETIRAYKDEWTGVK